MAISPEQVDPVRRDRRSPARLRWCLGWMWQLAPACTPVLVCRNHGSQRATIGKAPLTATFCRRRTARMSGRVPSSAPGTATTTAATWASAGTGSATARRGGSAWTARAPRRTRRASTGRRAATSGSTCMTCRRRWRWPRRWTTALGRPTRRTSRFMPETRYSLRLTCSTAREMSLWA